MEYHREALALPGEQVFWMAAFSFDMCDSRETHHQMKQLKLYKQLAKEDSHYMPPTMVDGKVQGAVTVSEGTLVLEDESTHESKEAEDGVVHAREEVYENEVTSEQSLADSMCHSGEVEGETQGGSTDRQW